VIRGRLPRYSIKELERRAAETLAAYLPAPVAVPVDVDLLAERLPGVDLDYTPGLLERFGLPGVVFRRAAGAYTIRIDMDVADHRLHFYRFTLAEEVAHIVLHGALIDQVGSTEEAARLKTGTGYEDLDRNARWFASALLIPPPHLMQDARTIYGELVGSRGFADPEGVKRDLLKTLSRRYQVSPAAMRYRLMHWPVKLVDPLARALRERSHSLE
jgi:hypothetical protein